MLVRLPKLKPSGSTGPMLPGFDIWIGKLSIDRLEIGRAVGGKARVGRLRASADIRSGRALVTLDAIVDGADRLALKLDAEPDGNRFDLEARLFHRPTACFRNPRDQAVDRPSLSRRWQLEALARRGQRSIWRGARPGAWR